jgi:FixJ family two-component response regulator
MENAFSFWPDVTAEEFRRRLAYLSNRETETMVLSWAGAASRQIAQVLGISHRTVEVYRMGIHKTMGMPYDRVLWTMVNLKMTREIFDLSHFVDRSIK